MGNGSNVAKMNTHTQKKNNNNNDINDNNDKNK